MSDEVTRYREHLTKQEKRKQKAKDEVLKLTRPPFSKSIAEIAHLINRSKTTVTLIRKELKKDGLLEVNEKGMIKKFLPESQVKLFEQVSQTEFRDIDSIDIWMKVMEKNNVKLRFTHMANMWKICKTLDKHPDIFLSDIFEAERYKDEFVKEFLDGKTYYLNKKNPKIVRRATNPKPKHYIDSIRSFRNSHGLQTPKGYLTVEQNSSEEYKKIKFSDLQIKTGMEMMKGIGETFYKLFVLHHEFGPRENSLFEMKITPEKKVIDVDGIRCEYYECSVFEEKQNRTFTKLAFTPEAKEVISSIKSGDKIHNITNNWKGKKAYNDALRNFYAQLGRIQPNTQYSLGTQEYYMSEYPSHAIRKSCVHWLMRCTGYRKDEVASFFWDKPETLELYDKATPDEILNRGVCYYCSPPEQPDLNYKTFCQLRHCFAYMNNGFKSKIL